jgi:hypothetical protein
MTSPIKFALLIRRVAKPECTFNLLSRACTHYTEKDLKMGPLATKKIQTGLFL